MVLEMVELGVRRKKSNRLVLVWNFGVCGVALRIGTLNHLVCSKQLACRYGWLRIKLANIFRRPEISRDAVESSSVSTLDSPRVCYRQEWVASLSSNLTIMKPSCIEVQSLGIH